MDKPDTIRPGSRVRMHFSLALADGTEAVSSFGSEPLEFTIGDGTLLGKLEENLIGLTATGQQQFLLSPEHAFGERDPALVHTMPRSDFSTPPEAGQVLAFSLPGGEQTAGLVLEVGDHGVKVDFNPPLAGHNVVFRVQILEVDNGEGGSS